MTTFNDMLREKLKDPEAATRFLEGMLEDYKKDGDTAMVLAAFDEVMKAQGCSSHLALSISQKNRQA